MPSKYETLEAVDVISVGIHLYMYIQYVLQGKNMNLN